MPVLWIPQLRGAPALESNLDSRGYEQILDYAASLWGIEPEFWDIWGRRHVTSAQTKIAILKSMGVPADSPEQLSQAIEDRLRQESSGLLPPCVVVSAPDPAPVPLRTPLNHRLAVVRLRLEDGSQRSFEGSLQDRIMLPRDLPLGYHDLEIEIAGAVHGVTRLIAAPDRAWLPQDLRAAGIAIPLYAVRSKRNWGCGDFGDLRDIVDWIHDEVGAGFVALNPLHAIPNRRPYNTSPYLPTSVFYQNLLYLDIEAIEDYSNSRRAARLRASHEILQELQELRDAHFVEYERVHALKLRFLKLLFLTFLRELRAGSPRALQFQEFTGGEGDLLDRFATWCALDEFIHARDPGIWIWPDWPEQFRDPESAAVAHFRRKHWRAVLFYKYVQWQLDLQLSAAQRYAQAKGQSIGLYHDLALATDRFGADLWAHRPFYIANCRVGSPPDDFSPTVQDWAFPPPDSRRHWESGYRLFAESIRKNCRHGGALRIDHVMRFFRLYWIPDGADATGGAYVRDRYQDLVRIRALESVLHRVLLGGEDLGTVEPSVRETLERFGILSYRLFYFERNERGDFRKFSEYPEQALVSSTTHDLPTLAGFWTYADIEARRRAGIFPDDQTYHAQMAKRADDKQRMLNLLFGEGLLPEGFPRNARDVPELTGELHNAVIGFLASTPSRLMVVNQEDLTKETEQQNLPGTTSQYPNWSRKMKFSVEELRSEKMPRDFVAMFRNWLERTGRVDRRD